MYIWKCWRDTRNLFFVLGIIAAAIMPFAAISLGRSGLMGFGAPTALAALNFLGMGASLGLGALMASEEFAQDTVSFLFTRPRNRAYFVWMGWVVGCTEFLLIAIINLSVDWATLWHVHAPVPGPVGLERFLKALIFFLYVYSLTFSLTAVLGSGLKGLGASVAFIFGWPGFALALEVKWKIHFPLPTERLWTLPIAASNVIWIATALLFVVFAQVVLEKWKG